MTRSEVRARTYAKRFLGVSLDKAWELLDDGELEHPFDEDLKALRAKIEAEKAAKELPKPKRTGIDQGLPLKHYRGREKSEALPSTALRAALGCRYPQLKRAAIDVIREAFRRCATKASCCRYLSINEETFDDLRRDFPLEFQKAANLKETRLPYNRTFF